MQTQNMTYKVPQLSARGEPFQLHVSLNPGQRAPARLEGGCRLGPGTRRTSLPHAANAAGLRALTCGRAPRDGSAPAAFGASPIPRPPWTRLLRPLRSAGAATESANTSWANRGDPNLKLRQCPERGLALPEAALRLARPAPSRNALRLVRPARPAEEDGKRADRSATAQTQFAEARGGACADARFSVEKVPR